MLRIIVSILLVNFTIFAALPCQQNAAKQTFKLSGIVMDITEARVVGATITVLGEGVERTFITADDGSYKVDLPLGIYSITVTGTGFCTARRPVFRVQSRADVKFNFTLVVCPAVNTINITNGQFKGESDSYQAPYKEDLFPIKSIEKPFELLIQYGERAEDKNIIQYAGFRSSIQYQYAGNRRSIDKCLGVTISYNLLTIHADKVRLDKKTLKLEAVGNVVVEDNKQLVRAKQAELTFEAGVPVINLTR